MTVKNIDRRLTRSDYFPHSHQINSEILYITNGTGRVAVGGEIYPVSEGDIVFCPKGCKHTGPGGECGLIYIVADVPTPDDLNHHFIVCDDGKSTARKFFETAYDLYNRPDNDTAYKKILVSLCELIFDIAFNLRRESCQDTQVNALVSAIDKGFSDCDFCLGEEMKKINSSVTYLRRKFGESIGMCPSNYLNAVRIGHAKKLIARRLENYISIADIAYNCGFRDERYFARVFKTYEGITPSGYLKQLK